jgi:hypothetical protein
MDGRQRAIALVVGADGARILRAPEIEARALRRVLDRRRRRPKNWSRSPRAWRAPDREASRS